ncbi:hypothetical protein [Sinorhizobium meliloti]|uniref:hypothetical protein n=1 Tax=Rhizobium meliloti TaxID=382 RepID=UPI00299CD82F
MPHKEIIKRSSGASASVRPPRGSARKPRFKSYQTRRTEYQERRSDDQWLIPRLPIELRGHKTAMLGLHVTFIDTDMTNGVVMEKTSPRQAAEAALIGLEANVEEVLVAP